MQGILFECQQQNEDGLILLVDFGNAFDRVDLGNVLVFIVIQRMTMFQHNSKAIVILNWHLSDPFNLHRGC